MDTNNNSNSTLAVAIRQALALPEVAIPPIPGAAIGKYKVAVGFLTQSKDADLIVASERIVVGMTGNAAYPTPNPTLAALIAARNSYIAAVNAAKDSKLGIVVRKQQRAGFTAMLRDLAHYVQVASGGDLAILLSSGFTAQRQRKPVGALPAPANLRLKRGRTSGLLIARCDKLPQAGAYEWRYANVATPTAWVDIEATFAARVTIEGLTPGAQYTAQARALGTAGPSDWSDTATLMVL
jgi:hypothetical protein